jgi:O-antigen/teichoic acid export membrane protein
MSEADPPDPLLGGVPVDVGVPLDPIARRADLKGRTLRQHAARGTLINGAFTVGINTLGLLRGFIVAGFLTSADYGVWGIIVIGFGTLTWLKQIGISDRYIQQDEDDQELAFQRAFTIEAMLNGILWIVILAAIPLIVLIYGHAEVVAPTIAVSFLFPLLVLQAPLWVFYRRMEYGRQRRLQTIEPLVSFVVTVGMAIAGAGYWAFVGGGLAGGAVGAIIAVRASPYKLAWRYDRGALRSYSRFSLPLLVATASGIVTAQAAIITASNTLGLAGVGAITLATSISQYTHRVDDVLTQTMYPAICAVADKTDLLFESFVKSNRLTLMWGVPFGVGVALFGADLVHFGIGERWNDAIGVIEATALVAAMNHVGFNWDAYFRARADTKPIAIYSALALASFLLGPIPLLIAYGLRGYAIGLFIVGLVALLVRGYYLARLFQGFRILWHAGRAAGPTVPAVAAVVLVRLVETGARTELDAVAEIAVYGIVTAIATWLLEGDLLREAIGYLRRGRGAVGAAAA